jgi:tRNA-specific 2-thiouridylase
VDRSGAVVGRHEGAHAFTVGQRRGLSLGVPAPDGKPRFVLEVRPVSNTVVVGPKEALATAEIAGERHSWAGRPQPEGVFTCDVQIRAHAEPVPARATLEAGVITVVPETPFDGVAPGQTAVLYDGTRVIGQFTIDRTESAVPVGA